MSKLLILLLCFIVGCKEEATKKPVTIVIDYSNKNWRLMDGDSVWWSIGEWVTDKKATDSLFEVGHHKEQDTVFGLKNFKPLVIIKDNGDTLRYWFGDTVRFNLCKPDTTYKIIYRDIKYADKVIIGGN